MIDTHDIQKEVIARVEKFAREEHTVNSLVSQLKKTITHAVMSKGITVDDSIDVAAKMIILASLVR